MEQTHSLWMQNGKLGCPSTCPWGQGNKTIVLWMLVFWTTPCKTKTEWEEGLWLSEKENGIIMGWISSPSATNGTR